MQTRKIHGSETLIKAVWRIRDVYPGSRILILPIPDLGSQISDPGSRIPDPTTAMKDSGQG